MYLGTALFFKQKENNVITIVDKGNSFYLNVQFQQLFLQRVLKNCTRLRQSKPRKPERSASIARQREKAARQLLQRLGAAEMRVRHSRREQRVGGGRNSVTMSAFALCVASAPLHTDNLDLCFYTYLPTYVFFGCRNIEKCQKKLSLSSANIAIHDLQQKKI